jgi:hypothetical protein
MQTENQAIWKMMSSPLPLASLVLWNSASYPWYAPILSIDRNVSPDTFQARCTSQQQATLKVPGEKNQEYRTFKYRKSQVAAKTPQREALKKKILEAGKWVKWELYSGYEDLRPQRGFAEPFYSSAIMTWREEDKLVKGGLGIYIGYEQLQPLVREDLADAKRRV